jgi:transcriptional regulator GlxA family with amidase domain
MTDSKPLETLIVAVPETAGSALYGMLDVLSVTGAVWQTLMRAEQVSPPFRVRVVSLQRGRFCCGNGIPVEPALALDDACRADIVILPELWLGPDESLEGRYPQLIAWIRARYEEGACVYSACSGALMLAETGLLDGRDATSHWGYQDLFKRRYPKIRFRPEPNLCFADPNGRIVTAGGTTSWHDLALHIISRHASPGEAMRIAKVYLLKWHDEGQLPFEPLVRQQPHSDAAVRSLAARALSGARRGSPARHACPYARADVEAPLPTRDRPRGDRLSAEPAHRRSQAVARNIRTRGRRDQL